MDATTNGCTALPLPLELRILQRGNRCLASERQRSDSPGRWLPGRISKTVGWRASGSQAKAQLMSGLQRLSRMSKVRLSFGLHRSIAHVNDANTRAGSGDQSYPGQEYSNRIPTPKHAGHRGCDLPLHVSPALFHLSLPTDHSIFPRTLIAPAVSSFAISTRAPPCSPSSL